MEIIVYLCVMRRKEERSLQKMCVRWFRLTQKEALIFAVPNGGSRNKLEAYQMKLEGVLAGVSDLLVIFRDRVLFIELKTTNGRQSKEQKHFSEQVQGLGFAYYLCRTFEEFQKIIKEHDD